jgi:hypothetical protein
MSDCQQTLTDDLSHSFVISYPRDSALDYSIKLAAFHNFFLKKNKICSSTQTVDAVDTVQ